MGDLPRSVALEDPRTGSYRTNPVIRKDNGRSFQAWKVIPIKAEPPMNPFLLSETSYGQVKARPFEVAVLPLGATEPHNLHLPYGTDTYQVEAVGRLACEKAHAQGASVALLPAIPYGTETNQMRFPMAMNLDPSTLLKVITDLVDSLATHRVNKCILLNGHGGNDLKWILRELHLKTPVQLFACHWWKMAADRHKDLFEDPGDHAGELETSMILAHRPDLVVPGTADNGSMAPTRFEAVNKGYVEITRAWHLLTSNSGAGNPAPATAEKGRALTDVVVDRLATFLVDLAASPIDDRFPF